MNAADADLAAALRQELARLQRCNPLAVLGLGQGASKGEIRAAFLAATKQHHPTRFARKSREVVRLANEVFLLIKSAYQELNKKTPAGPPGAGRPRTSITFRSPGRPARTTPPSSPALRPPVAAPGRPARTTPPRSSSSPAIKPPAPAPSRPVRTTPPSSPGIRLPGRPGRTTPVSSPAITPPGTRPSRAPSQPPVHQAGMSRDQAFDQALTLCQRGQWTEARSAFEKLVVRCPGDVQVQAYFHYALGCEQQSLGNLSGARAAYERALAVVPSFDVARRALTMLARTTASKPDNH